MFAAGEPTSDNGHYVTLARRVFPGVRTLAYGQTATVRGEASDALCGLMYQYFGHFCAKGVNN
jgi:hypothetical protein